MSTDGPTLSQQAAAVERAAVAAVINYDPMTGDFRWKFRNNVQPVWNVRYAGKLAGYIRYDGYRDLCFFNKHYLAHRVAWLLVHGAWPEFLIDHRNMKKDDNRIVNLREATMTQNLANAEKQKANTSGFKGVGFVPRIGRWRARIKDAGKEVHLGYFDSPAEAASAYKNAAVRIHGEFARW